MTHAPTDDETLAALIADAGLDTTPYALRDLLRGIAAAPAGGDPDAWLVLVAPNAEPAMADRLRAVKAALSACPTGTALALTDRVGALRERLAADGLDGFVVPQADAHQGEYIPANAERLAWLTGFTGSAGVAVVLRDRAAIFVDGRYTLQVEDQVDHALFERRHLMDQPPEVIAIAGPYIRLASPVGSDFGTDGV